MEKPRSGLEKRRRSLSAILLHVTEERLRRVDEEVEQGAGRTGKASKGRTETRVASLTLKREECGDAVGDGSPLPSQAFLE